MRNLFRHLAFGASTLLVLSLCAGCNSQGRRLLSAEELQWLSDRNNTILIVPSADYPPVSFIDEAGDFDGISSDYLEILERKIGVKFHIVEYANPKEVLSAMETRAVDVISAVVRSPGGSEDLLFSEPYVESPAIILTRQSIRETISLETMGNLTVGVAEGYGVEEIIGSRYADIRLLRTANNLQGIRDLSEGRIDAFITDLKVASHYIEREGIANLRVAGETGFSYTISFGCSRTEPILAGILNKGLSLITETERYAVEQRWGSVLAIPSSGQYWNAAFVFIGFGLAAALFIFFLLRPDRAIRQRGAAKTGKGRLRKALRVFIVYYWPVYTILLLAVALTLGIYFSSLVEDRALTETEREWLDKNRESLVLGLDSAWPPFEFIDESGEYRGLSAEYVAVIEKELGIRFVKTRTGTPGSAESDGFNQGIDIAAAMPMTRSSASRFLFTEPYYEVPMVIITRKSFSGELAMENLGDYSIAAAVGYPAADLVADASPGLELIPVPDLVTGLRMVSFDEVDGMVIDITSALYYIDKEGITNLRIAGNTGIAYGLRLAVSKDLPILHSAVSKALASIGEKERREINGRWIRAEQSGVWYNRKILYGVGIGLVLAVFVVVVVLLWNWTLREQVHNHTLAMEEELRKRTAAERELQLLNAELESRVTERTRELEEALERQKEIQSQLVQTEKLAALGGLVAGVAHEINTPVGVAVTAVSHVLTKTEKMTDLFSKEELRKSDLKKFLDTVERSSSMALKNLQRAGELIQSFKQVAVDQTSDEQRIFNVNGYLAEIFLSLNPKLRKTNFRVSIDCPEDLEIESFPGAFSQIITNFVVNSLMHGFEGRTEGTISIAVSLQGGLVRIIYGDDGNGIDPENIPRIFDPFFTTKRGQGGSGLGLHIVYNLVTQILGGSIRCESQPGTGASFILLIPVRRSPSRGR